MISDFKFREQPNYNREVSKQITSEKLVELITWIADKVASPDNTELLKFLASVHKNIPLAYIFSNKSILEISKSVNTTTWVREQLLSTTMIFTTISHCEDYGYQAMLDVLIESFLRTNDYTLKQANNLLDERVQEDIFIDSANLKDLLNNNPWFVIIILSYFI